MDKDFSEFKKLIREICNYPDNRFKSNCFNWKKELQEMLEEPIESFSKLELKEFIEQFTLDLQILEKGHDLHMLMFA